MDAEAVRIEDPDLFEALRSIASVIDGHIALLRDQSDRVCAKDPELARLLLVCADAQQALVDYARLRCEGTR